MTLVEFARLVADMRRSQKEYFRTRSASALEQSRAAEKRVDKAVVEVMSQPQLFA